MMRYLLAIVLLSAAVFAAYPQTAGDVTDAILGCKNNPCYATTAACATTCDSDHDECFANCHGAQSACFNLCDLGQQACSEDCILVHISCVKTCLNDKGFSACTSVYNIQNEQPFIDCVLSHAPMATQTPAATPARTPTPQQSPTSSTHCYEQSDCPDGYTCANGSCVQTGACGSSFIIAGLGFAAFLVARRS